MRTAERAQAWACVLRVRVPGLTRAHARGAQAFYGVVVMAGRGKRVAGVALLVMVASGGLWLSTRLIENAAPQPGHRSALCASLAEDVPGVGTIHWDNGITAGGSAWIQVLGTDGLQYADSPSRERIATGVAADSDGFQRVRSAAPDDLRPALDRLRALALDPALAAARADDPALNDDIMAVVRTSDCGWAP